MAGRIGVLSLAFCFVVDRGMWEIGRVMDTRHDLVLSERRPVVDCIEGNWCLACFWMCVGAYKQCLWGWALFLLWTYAVCMCMLPWK